MTPLKSLIYKDSLLLIRDKAGLCMMFLMPMLLVVIMAYLQDSAFNVMQETRIPLLLINNDHDSLGIAIERQMEASGIFAISREIEGKTVDKNEMVQAVASGDFMIGVVIPENATRNIRKNVKRYVTGVFNGQNITPAVDSVQVDIFIDPVAKSSFLQTLMSAMREYAVRTESDFLFKEISAEVEKISPMPMTGIQLSRNQVRFREQYAMPDSRRTIPNSTQHNIPAWSMFAIFFITISLSGNMIKEREDGSFTRLRTMPCPHYLYISGKVAVYLFVCLLQFTAIFLMGIYLFPLLGLSTLTLGAQPLLLLPVGICSALAAISYGVTIGKLATSHQQAAIFASISVVIMAATGGIWIPVFAMPEAIQWVSHISPLNWGLEGFYDVILRGGSLRNILPECAASLAFAVLCLWVANQKTHESI